MPVSIKKISVLGCGWLGLPLASALIQAGYQVSGSTTSVEKIAQLQAQGIRPYLIRVGEQLEGDPADFFRTDLLILNIPPGRRRQGVADLYPAEMQLLLEYALRDGLQRLIFISSTGVYADVNRVVTEMDEVWSKEGSGLALVRTEQYLQNIPDLPLTILRLAGLVGGERKAGRFLAGKKDVADGNAPVNMVHRDDCIQVIQAIISNGIWGQIFNVCADEHPTRQDFYTHQALKDGFDPPTFVASGDPAFKIISSEKLKASLGYTFLHPDPLQF